MVFVTRPERCPTVTPTNVAHAAAAAAHWYDTNQHDDGSWIYRYNRRPRPTSATITTPALGVLLALYLFGDLPTADRGTDSRPKAPSRARRGSFGDGRTFDTGASALLVTALGQRRLDTGDPKYDKDLADLGHFLVGMVGPDGKVFANWLPATQSAVGTLSFSTGELWFALTRLERLFPDSGWRSPPRRGAVHHAAPRRRREHLPADLDHWGAYAPTRCSTGDAAVAGPHRDDRRRTRLAGIFGVQVRWESQRTNQGVNLLLRGYHALLRLVADREDGEGDERDRGRRASADGQVGNARVGGRCPEPVGQPEGGALGRWFDSNITQMDYQQHALETLVAYG